MKNEAENIEFLAREITDAVSRQQWSWECVWVDDGSTDATPSILRKIHIEDRRHRYISFKTNAGQSAALWAGFREAAGEILATIDGDGQNDPSDIPALVEMVLSGSADMVNGYRQRRRDGLIRKWSSRIANGFRNRVTGNTVRDVGCSTRAFRRECVRALPRFAGMHRFLPTLVEMQGYRLNEVPVNHRPRLRGTSKYGINNRLWVGLLDTFGVWWLKRRAFRFEIASGSQETGATERTGDTPATVPGVRQTERKSAG